MFPSLSPLPYINRKSIKEHHVPSILRRMQTSHLSQHAENAASGTMWTATVQRSHLQSLEKLERRQRKPVLQRMRRHGAGRVGATGKGQKSRKGQEKTAGESGDQTSDARGKDPFEETAEGGGKKEEKSRPEAPPSVQG